MTMDITQSVVNTLASLFPGTTIYRNRQESGFRENSFYVKLLSGTGSDQLFNHQLRSYLFSVKYFPPLYPEGKSQRLEEQCEKMAEQLMPIRYLSDMTGILMRKEWETVDGELVFKFVVSLRVKFDYSEEEDYDWMRHLDQEVYIKDE